MGDLYAVFLMSLDQNLQVFTNKAQAQAKFDELQAADEPVRMEVFTNNQLVSFLKENGCFVDDEGFWEELIYQNSNCQLVEYFCWHKEPQKPGYYADYSLRF